MANIDLTTNGWCDLIFEGRNKAYGAYKLREGTPRRNLISIITIAVLAALLILGFWAKTRYDEYQLAHAKNEAINEISVLNQPTKKEAKVERKVQVEEKKEVVKEVKSSIKFTAPVIKKDNLVKPEEEMKTQAELMNNNTAIGALNIEGNSDHGEVLKVVETCCGERNGNGNQSGRETNVVQSRTTAVPRKVVRNHRWLRSAWGYRALRGHTRNGYSRKTARTGAH